MKIKTLISSIIILLIINQNSNAFEKMKNEIEVFDLRNEILNAVKTKDAVKTAQLIVKLSDLVGKKIVNMSQDFNFDEQVKLCIRKIEIEKMLISSAISEISKQEAKSAKKKRKRDKKKLKVELCKTIQNNLNKKEFLEIIGTNKISEHLKHNSIHNTTKTGQTILHVAVQLGNFAAVEKLLKLGADPNKPNFNGITPLHVLAICSHEAAISEKIAKILIDYGANIEAQTYRDGWTPLHVAMGHNNLTMACILLNLGSNLKAVTREKFEKELIVNKKTPSELAILYKAEDVIDHFKLDRSN